MKSRTTHVRLIVYVALTISAAGAVQARDVKPGYDLLVTGAESAKSFGGAAPDEPAIPAGFFGPGSLPFVGTVSLKGVPLGTYLGHNVGHADTITKRLQTAVLPTVGSSTTIQFQLVALSLASSSPITVTFNDSLRSELWDLRISASPTLASNGTATITQSTATGGTYTTDFTVFPLMTFTKVADPNNVKTLDYGQQGLGVPMTTEGVTTWEYQPTNGQLVAPGLSGDQTNLTGAPWTNDFYVTRNEDHHKVHKHLSVASSSIAAYPAISGSFLLITGILIMIGGSLVLWRRSLAV